MPPSALQLDTARLVLRKLQRADVAAWLAIRSHPLVLRFQPWSMRDEQDALAFIVSLETLEVNTPNTWFQLALVQRDRERLVGDMGVHFLEDTQQVELGITLAPAEQGHGYAAEAMRAVLDYLFGVLGKHRVYASTDPHNSRCIALLSGLGMRNEGHLVESYRFRGRWVDELIFALLEREWRELRAGKQG